MILVQVLLHLILSAHLAVPPPPMRLKIGDSLKIVTNVNIAGTPATMADPYQGDFAIESDGAIYGVGFGRLVMKGRTLSEAEALVRRAMAKLVKPSEVFVTLKYQRVQNIYLVGRTGVHSGTIPFIGPVSLRQSLAGLSIGDESDSLQAVVFRNGATVATRNIQSLLRGDKGQDLALLPDDVVAINTLAAMRIWITGAVRSPGRLQLPEGTKLAEVIAAAGGPVITTSSDNQTTRREYTVLLQRGTQTQRFPLDDTNSSDWPTVEAGDTVTILAPARARVVIGGEIMRPGDFLLKPDTSILELLAQGGGPTKEGSISNVIVFRGSDRFSVDARVATSGATETPRSKSFVLADGDLVVVQRNQRMFIALGAVNKQGDIPLPDDKKIFASDALGLAGGLTQDGTLRRLFISRAGKGGKAVTTEYNLDEYLKDGNARANPEILPGDVLLFSRSGQTTLTVASQVIGSFLIFNNLSGRR